jgi:ATP-dependent protease ClpP protease subunit
MSGEEAVNYGLIDIVLDKRSGPLIDSEEKSD